MEEKQVSIHRELNRILQEWSAGTAFIGAALVLLLSPLDFYAVPTHAVRFLAYRLAVMALLIGGGAFLRRPRTRALVRWVIFVSVLATAGMLAAMIMDFGGHHSPYLIGLVLVAVTVLGLIPSGPGFATLLAGTIFAVYLGPILAWDTVHEPGFFAVETVLFAAILVTGVLVSWLHKRRLEHELSLRHDLTRSRERLEEESARRAQAAAGLRESLGLLSSISTAAVDAIVMIDPEGKIRHWNPAAERIIGHSAAATLGRDAFALFCAPERAGEVLTDHRAWLAAGARRLPGRRVMTQGRRSNGESFPMELTMSLVEREGRPWTCAMLRDVTEQVRAEERLRLFATAVEGAPEGFFIVGLEGRFLYVNPALSAIFGLESPSFIGRSVTDFHLPPAQATDEIIPAVVRAGSWSGEVVGRGGGGQPIPLWLTASLVRGSEGRPIAIVGIVKDFTEQRRLEEERFRAQKLESIGVLAGGLAHDFNNLLTIILGNLDLARVYAGANPDAAEALDHAGEAAQRAGDLTRQLITFSKGGQPVKRVGSIVRTVRETVAFAAAGSNVSCVFELPEDLPVIEFDEGQMRQVVHNLVRNAREAMPGGGTLQVSGCALQVAEGEIHGLPAGRFLRLQFRDGGSGIDRAILSRIFDPYFSTKEMGTAKGRGLGLAVSFSIVRNHGGTITADSVIGAGTTISLYLPESPRTPEAQDDGGRGPDSAAGDGEPAQVPGSDAGPPPEIPAKGRVLVMDDEPLVLEMAGAFLRRLGYAAMLARSSAEAVVLYQIGLDTGRRFDAVILDLTVPGSPGGQETLARLREIDPAVRAVLSSGYADHPAVTDWAGAGFAAFIAKPYSIKAFEEALARVL